MYFKRLREKAVNYKKIVSIEMLYLCTTTN